jgi:hypothetical protein
LIDNIEKEYNIMVNTTYSSKRAKLLKELSKFLTKDAYILSNLKIGKYEINGTILEVKK